MSHKIRPSHNPKGNARLVEAPPAAERKPTTFKEYFAVENQQLVVRRGELLSALEIYFKTHLHREHTSLFGKLWARVRYIAGRPLDPLAAHRGPQPEEE